MSKGSFPGVNPVLAALSGKCPRCGKGALFRNPVALGRACGFCELDFTHFDRQGDGPAVFSLFIVGFLVVAAVFVLELSYQPPIWVHALVSLILGGILTILSLRLFKAWLVGEQFRHDADEGRLADDDDD